MGGGDINNQIASGQSGRGGHYQQKSVTPKVSRFYKDQLGGKRAQYLTSRGEKSRGTPFRIRVHTQNAKQEGTAPTPEVLRNAEHSQEPLSTLLLEESLNLTPCKNASTISDSNVLSESQFFQYYSLGNTLSETEGDPILYHNNLYNPNFDYRDTMDGRGMPGELTGEDNRLAAEDNRIAAEKKTREINLNQLQPTDQPRDQRILTSPGPYQGLPAWCRDHQIELLSEEQRKLNRERDEENLWLNRERNEENLCNTEYSGGVEDLFDTSCDTGDPHNSDNYDPDIDYNDLDNEYQLSENELLEITRLSAPYPWRAQQNLSHPVKKF